MHYTLLDFVAYKTVYPNKIIPLQPPSGAHNVKQFAIPRILRKRLIYLFIYILTQRHKPR